MRQRLTNFPPEINAYSVQEIRKLILGVYQELPANTSWRFVEGSFVFPNPQNPFQTVFPESAAGSPSINANFKGVKIGDVNCTALGAKYAYDVNPPGLLYGRILRSPHAAAVIKGINLDRARALPGVRAIVLVEGIKPGARLRYQGDEILGLAAVSKQAADDALRAITVEYEVLPHVVNVEPARAADAPRVFERNPNVADPKPKITGDAAAVFRDPAAVVVEGTFRTPVQVHSPLETHGLTAQLERGRADGLGVHAGRLSRCERDWRRPSASRRTRCGASAT